MTAAKKLRLGPLPKTESIKLTFACPASLKVDLDHYAALHAQTYGESVDAVTLIPHMLEAFIAGDRGFKKGSIEARTAEAAPARNIHPIGVPFPTALKRAVFHFASVFSLMRCKTGGDLLGRTYDVIAM